MASMSDPHLTKLNNCGGYATNLRTKLHSDALQQKYNPGLLKDIRASGRNLSVTTCDYPPPPPYKTGLECCPNGPIPVLDSGYTKTKPLHNPTVAKVIATNEALIGKQSDRKISLKGDCSIPAKLMSEVSESYGPHPIHSTTTNKFICEDPPGSRDSGYSKNVCLSFNPVTCRDLSSTMDQAMENIRGRMNIASVTKADFQPYQILSGKEGSFPLSSTATRDGTGFTRAKELKPCFLPDKVPADVDPCYKNNRYITMYTQDYYPKMSGHCDVSGKKIVGKPPRTAFNQESELSLCHRCPVSPYLTETMERFVSPTPEGRARDGHLRGAVFGAWESPYVYSNLSHTGKYVDKCTDGTYSRLEGPIEPVRNKPLEKLTIGHKTLLNKNYRPEPSQNILWTEVQVEPNLNFNSSNPII